MRQQLYHGGEILTLDETNARAEAVLVEDGRIAKVGSLREIEAVASAKASRRDLCGRTMIPGFIDPHGHFPDSGFLKLHRADLSTPPIGECRCLSDVFDRLRQKAANTEPGKWVIGSMFEPSGLAEKRFPTRQELDKISSEHPIWVVHISGHAGVANSLALAFRGIDRDTATPKGGHFGRDPSTGDLDGLLDGMAAMGNLGDSEFQITYDKFRSAFKAAAEEYLAQGVTLAQNAWATKSLLGYFGRIATEDAPEIDVMVLPAGFLEPKVSRQELDVPLPPPGSGIILGPRKLFGDGSFHMQTACMTQPYHKPLNGEVGYRCELAVTPEQMAKRIGKLHGLGFQCHIHANGDATADLVLDAIETVQERDPREDHRHTLIHAQTLREDQLDRMAALGVTASFFPAHIYYWGDYHRDTTLGPERVQNMCPARWAADRNIRFTIHNDAQVTPTLPLHLMWCAVNRLSVTGSEIGKQQALTPLEALRAHTIDAAWQVFQEHDRGSIETGKRADFAILSASPVQNPSAIKDITVQETVVCGEIRYLRTTSA
ncbi:MAG: amidohydrolase [Pseudomonadota bacterium]